MSLLSSTKNQVRQNMPAEWVKAVEVLKGRLGTEVVGRWIEPLEVSSVSDDAAVFEAPNPFFRDWVAAHYAPALRDSLGGRHVTIVASSSPPPSGAGPESGRGTAAPTAVGEEKPPPLPGSGALNPKFTFDRFVVGPSNRFAHAASLAVAESPAKAYNPLFIYGGVGLGKTHLMQAIGHAIARRTRGAKVVYLSSEHFTNELIAAIQTRTTARFRERYRTVDALLVDDIHFIAGRESTQEEFFHTFNALYDAHKQIVISSDRSPKDIAGLEERLVSRFEWGLVTDIQPPDLETRIAILRKKVAEADIAVPGEVTDFIAKRITANIRELEGALIRVVAYSRFFSKPLSVEVAQEVLKDMVREVGSRLTIEVIQQRVGEHFRVLLEELKGPSRQRSVLYPRQLAMYLCRKLTDSSLPEIGQAFGGRNHTTVMHAIAKIEQAMAQDGHKKHVVELLLRTVTTTAS
ncbi:MAG: chromosomal replication initiator protein DnaA [Candidatus Omnitrophica bacterium]|nr:chromosomal replication initiator protein DnaA [Candidatus Omnitrophota bacterium]